MGRPLTDDQDSEGGGRGLLGSEDVATTTFPSVLALREPGPLSPLGWEGRSLCAPPLGPSHWFWLSSLELCSQLIRPGPEGPFLVVWEPVCDRLFCLSRGLQGRCI